MPDDVDERLNAILRAVGHITLVWANIDTLLDYSNVQLKQDFGGHPNGVELPRTQLSRKLDYFRTCIAHIPELARDRERGIELADEIKRLSNDRHWVIHGAADTSGNKDLIRFIKTRMTGTPSIEERHSSLADIEEFGRASTAAGIKLTLFLAFALLRLSQDEFDKVRSKLLAQRGA